MTTQLARLTVVIVPRCAKQAIKTIRIKIKPRVKVRMIYAAVAHKSFDKENKYILNAINNIFHCQMLCIKINKMVRLLFGNCRKEVDAQL